MGSFLYFMKKSLLALSLFSSIALIGVSVFQLNNQQAQKRLTSEQATGEYVLSLHNQKISNESTSYIGEISSSINTDKHNSIEIRAYNVLNYNDGWQTLLPQGYFYNPLNNSNYLNKINGITSVRFDSLEDKTLSLYYGYSLDGTNIIYSQEKEIYPHTTYYLQEDRPSYFYIKNNNDVSVNITSFSISYSCIEETHPRKDLKVLMIGNSFADDTLFYSARVAGSYGFNLTLYDAYIAGCTINQHYTNLNNDSTSYSMRRLNGSQWDYRDNMSLRNIVLSNSWDIITFQQASAEVGRSDSYNNLASLVSSVRSLVGSTPKFYWHQTWAYDSDYHDYYDYFSYFNNDQIAMYDAINDCYSNRVAALGVFEKMIPAGTAVQNMRTSYMKETFTRDGKHMSSVHGRYLLALNFLSNVFDVDLDMSPCSYLPNEVDPSFNNVAYESIKNAYKNPLNFTNSKYLSRDLGSYNLSDYTEIDAELVGCSYWNSTDSSNYNKRQSNVKDVSNLYVSSKRFTSSTLPIGSLVVVDDAFGYRPDAWISDSVQYSRPEERYDNILEITSSFFSNYQYRAFNIFKAGKTELKGQYDQIFDGFHIYVPNSALGSLKPKDRNDDYYNDQQLFVNSYKNIDAYERIHLDPITGFYKCDSYYELTNSYVDDTAKKFLCTRPFYASEGDLPSNTVIIVDSGYQWRSDCWGSHGSYSPRPNNVSSPFTVLDSSFWSGFRRRTFNVSSTSSAYVNQNYISFMNHLRIYVPISDDTDIEPDIGPTSDKVAMVAKGTATFNSMFGSAYGKTSLPVLVTLHGDDVNKVSVTVDGNDALAYSYSYNKSTGEISIPTSGSASGYSFGTITGTVQSDQGRIINLGLDGSIKSFMTNNYSITCLEKWFDRCDYSSDAASQVVWQRWYMNNSSWTANSGAGDWTSTSSTYKFDNDHSLGLRIANNSFVKTRFTLVNDFNSGSGLTFSGLAFWIYNPNGSVYPSFKVFVYKNPSPIVSGHASPDSSNYSQAYYSSSIVSNSWRYTKVDLSSYGTIYNVSFYFESSSSQTTYLYLGHVSFY